MDLSPKRIDLAAPPRGPVSVPKYGDDFGGRGWGRDLELRSGFVAQQAPRSARAFSWLSCLKYREMEPKTELQGDKPPAEAKLREHRSGVPGLCEPGSASGERYADGRVLGWRAGVGLGLPLGISLESLGSMESMCVYGILILGILGIHVCLWDLLGIRIPVEVIKQADHGSTALVSRKGPIYPNHGRVPVSRWEHGHDRPIFDLVRHLYGVRSYRCPDSAYLPTMFCKSQNSRITLNRILPSKARIF